MPTGSKPLARNARLQVAAAAVGVVVVITASRDGAQDAIITREAVAAPAPRSRALDTLPRTWIEMKNVNLRVATNAVVGIRQLRGEVISANASASAFLDSTTSFSIRITSGSVSLASADLGVILNTFVFAYKGSPLRDLRVHTRGNELVQSGIMHKGVDLKFEISSSLALTDSGWIKLHPTKVRVMGVNGQSLLDALGLELDDLLDLSKSPAARVKGNDIYLDPMKILPPPAISGRLASVRVEGDALVQEFVKHPDDSVFARYARPDSAAPNYMFFRGGRLRFGRLEMRDTQLQILDLDPADPFDLYLAEYNRQLVAGYSRNRPNLSLQAFFPDYADLSRSVASPVARR